MRSTKQADTGRRRAAAAAGEGGSASLAVPLGRRSVGPEATATRLGGWEAAATAAEGVVTTPRAANGDGAPNCFTAGAHDESTAAWPTTGPGPAPVAALQPLLTPPQKDDAHELTWAPFELDELRTEPALFGRGRDGGLAGAGEGGGDSPAEDAASKEARLQPLAVLLEEPALCGLSVRHGALPGCAGAADVAPLSLGALPAALRALAKLGAELRWLPRLQRLLEEAERGVVLAAEEEAGWGGSSGAGRLEVVHAKGRSSS